MAKTSANALHKRIQWTRSELDALPGRLDAKRQEKLAALGRRLDKGLSMQAFAACDKADYAADKTARRLADFDQKQYLKYRAVNHGCAKDIFQAIRAGQDWTSALEAQQRKVKVLREKRDALVSSLRKREAAFAARHPASDPKGYEEAARAARETYEAKARQLEAAYAKTLADRSRALTGRLERYEAKAEQLRAASKGTLTLPDDVLLRVEGLKMYFGGLKAVDDLTFDVKKGEIFGLIGPNGAGKTTVFNCITRFYNATGGNMHFENKSGEVIDLRNYQVHDVITQGITRTFQNVELVREISVLDNLLVACTQDYRASLLVQALGLPSLRREEALLKEKARRILKFMGLESYAGWLAMGLPYGVLKKVEIARALMSDAKLIIMDEPAAGLNDTETAELTATIRRIRDEFGVTILLVEHDMGLVMTVCDTVCAISFGRMLAIGTREEIKGNKAVQEAYLGVEEDE